MDVLVRPEGTLRPEGVILACCGSVARQRLELAPGEKHCATLAEDTAAMVFGKKALRSSTQSDYKPDPL